MGIRRYELSEAQWSRIALLVPGKTADPGRTGSDNRLFVNGCLWGAALWRPLVRSAERYGQVEDGASAFQPLVPCWRLERVFEALTVDRDNQYLMIDSTIVRAHQQAATGKGGARIRRWGVPEAD